MIKRTIFGLPLNPQPKLNELDGESFCVSFATRKKLGKQLEQAIELVGADGILMIDNGAFSAWQKGEQLDAEGFVEWAADICQRCPQAVVVVPDEIDADHVRNAELMHEFGFDLRAAGVDDSQLMVVWHMHEPLEHLEYLLESGFQYIAIGSSGEFSKCGTQKWCQRIEQAMQVIDAAECRPWVHMMRAQASLSGFDFDSADSTNVAMNHGRYKAQGEGHVRAFADRVKAPITASCNGIERDDVGFGSPAAQATLAQAGRELEAVMMSPSVTASELAAAGSKYSMQ